MLIAGGAFALSVFLTYLLLGTRDTFVYEVSPAVFRELPPVFTCSLPRRPLR